MTARALTIAGSDPSGGAGIQQDLKTFEALGVWGMSTITAITVQDTARVHSWRALEPNEVRAQIDAVANDIGVDAAKTGMLANGAIVDAVARAIKDHGIDALVVDPVLAATSGDALSADEVVFAIRELLLPRALIVTPNIDEAFQLTGVEVTDLKTQEEAARALVALGARSALVTGGHLDGGDITDVLCEGSDIQTITALRLRTEDTHGSGCVLSAAITAGLALGKNISKAVADAKEFVTRAIEHSLELGKGAVVVDPGWLQRES